MPNHSPTELSADHPMRPSMGRALVALSAIAAVAMALLWALFQGKHVSLPDASRPLNSAVKPPVSEQKCVACHEDQVHRFADAPHHNTLLAGHDPRVLALLGGQSFTDSGDGTTFEYTVRDQHAWLTSDRRSQPIRVDWLFGSGHHAMTPVSVVEEPGGDSLVLQHVMSWYPDHSIGWTLGLNPQNRDHRGIQALANPHTAQESRSCFLCHTTWLPEVNDHLQLSQAIPNVTCTRCHPQAEQHINHPDNGSIERWSELTALESVNRCGECHRRADHFTADELVTSNKLLVRFASASLVQTGCFVNQTKERRFDCMTCHDPHQPASTDSAFYNQRCLQCHAASSPDQCTFANTSEQCIRCHMPKVEAHDGLSFTDHWIRRRAGRDAPAGEGVGESRDVE